jgi:serine/threonine protein kinase
LVFAFEQSGFNSYIDFSDLKFDLKTDFVGGGGYGDVYKGTWEGTPVAIKKFGKRYLATKKALKDFIKEIEVLSQLRHPHIV